ncbi:MAG: hypothetical protein FWH01_11700 [Oscillospiraceae bacterium]|nr:hypothetical protein [Oscillospiraceae bacterium]
MTITVKERGILRELAKRQAEIAALPVMAEREALWRGLNGGKTEHPLVTMEFHGIESEVYPAPNCEGPLALALERQMVHYIFKHEQYKDDRVIPASVSVAIPNSFTPFGFLPEIIHMCEADGAESLAYRYGYVLNDLEADSAVFGASTRHIDAGLAETHALMEQAQDVLGDILAVRAEFRPVSFNPAGILLRYMGMETMFMSIMDYPELFHKIVRRLTDEYLAYVDALEAGGALAYNNDATTVPQDSYGYTDDLPGAGGAGNIGAEAVGAEDAKDAGAGGTPAYPAGSAGKPLPSCAAPQASDLWVYANSQETVGMSAAMYDEFFFSYAKEVTDRFGLVSYGCCEPVHTIWAPCLSRMKNLRKVSVSPWCDERALGDMIRGTKVCYHRKPSPNYISVDSVFNEEAFLAHMEETVKAAAGCPLEITFRDITSVRGEPQRLTRAVELTRKAFARHWHG